MSKNIEQSDEISTISVNELCESIRLISAFGSLPDLPAKFVHQSCQTPITPGSRQVCQFCEQICKNRAGLLTHQRLNKFCKEKQQEPGLMRIVKVD